jgi:hypothetical protein
MVEITYQMVLSTIQTIALVVGIIYYLTIMRNTQRANEQHRKERKRELIFQKSQTYTKEYFQTLWEVTQYRDWKTPEEFIEKHGPPNNTHDYANYSYTMRNFHLAGLLLMENNEEADLIFKLYPPQAIMGMWEQYKPIIMRTRETRNNPEHLSAFEYLYNEAKKRYPNIKPQWEDF